MFGNPRPCCIAQQEIISSAAITLLPGAFIAASQQNYTERGLMDSRPLKILLYAPVTFDWVCAASGARLRTTGAHRLETASWSAWTNPPLPYGGRRPQCEQGLVARFVACF